LINETLAAAGKRTTGKRKATSNPRAAEPAKRGRRMKAKAELAGANGENEDVPAETGEGTSVQPPTLEEIDNQIEVETVKMET